MIDVKELQILNKKECRCSCYKFSLEDIHGIEILQDAHGFYGNLVKYYAKAVCPKCGKETILLLKQKGQTWEIMNTAISTLDSVSESESSEIEFSNNGNEEDNYIEQSKMENKEDKNETQEFICPECQKVCKSQLGLNAHMRTHNN